MKRGIMILALLQMVVSIQAVVYKLEKVTKVVSGEKYVLVQNDYTPYADLTNLSGGYWLKKTDYKTEHLTGDENYVWTFQGKSNYYKIINGNVALKRTTGNLFTFATISEGSVWNVEFEDGQAVLFNTITEVKYIGKKNDAQLSLYSNKSKSTNNTYFDLYHLVPETYERELTKLNIGTICLPYAVDSVTGAEVYELSYLEKDAQENPYNVYYTQQVNTMEAGKPYIFVPSETKVVFQKANATTVSSPADYRGFYGTFSNITDGEEGAVGNLLENKYVLSNNMFQLCGDHCQMGAYRGYFNFAETPTTPPTQGVQQRMVAIGQEGVRYIEPHNIGTGIENENVNANVNKVVVDGQLQIVINGVHYNTQGQRL